MARLLIIPALLLVVVAAPTPAQHRHHGARALVNRWYERYLLRELGPREGQGHVDALRSGMDPNEVLAHILGSQEYYDKAGQTPDGFVRRLYADLAGRAPTDRELAYWKAEVHRQPLSNLAYSLLTRFPQTWDDTVPAWKNQHEYRRPYQRYR
jgi:hypothetical protein